ncbi:AGAP011006-PA-like protein [Anopheles sinensis]|uniref:AGAP011006-PA-like protein n=1 Tax=Anopheles sinensis TaxID=74873 RepID=A0A084W975_ANOSI|nr:AGAP011006-PA-like protein [Anopheles sinensis]
MNASLQNIIQLSRVEIFDTPTLRVTASVDPYGPPPVTAVNLRANLTKALVDFKLNGVLTLRTKTGRLENALYNSTINACAFFRKPSLHRLLYIVQQEVYRYSDLPTRCPAMPKIYNIRNASFVNARVPSFLPAAHFRVEVNLLHGNPEKLILSTHWYGMLKKVKG